MNSLATARGTDNAMNSLATARGTDNATVSNQQFL
jgi:hypothetical protein